MYTEEELITMSFTNACIVMDGLLSNPMVLERMTEKAWAEAQLCISSLSWWLPVLSHRIKRAS